MSPLMEKTIRTRILDYIGGKDKIYPSDIAYDLDIDYDEVCDVLNHLRQEGIIEEMNDK